jgi:hypothetical protein
MRKKFRLQRLHARYDHGEKGFICTICERNGFTKWVYDAWEIPKHLKATHKILRKDQLISGWNAEYEKEYLKKRKKPVKFEHDQDSLSYDGTPEKEIRKEKVSISCYA